MRVLKANTLVNKSNLTKEEWCGYRRKGIGGSDAAAITNMNQYQSQFALYADKLGLIGEIEDNEKMRQGRDLEEYVAKRFVQQTGKRVKNCNYILQHPEHDFMLANVDRLIVGENAGLECKTTSSLSLKQFKNGEYPDRYYAQCMHYMAVTGAKKWYLAVLILNDDFKIFTVDRDEDEINLLIAAEKRFWLENVLKQVPPPIDGSESTKNTLSEMHSDVFSAPEELTLTCADIVYNLAEIKAQIKLLEVEKDKCENIIKAELKDNERAVCGDYKVSWTSSSRSTFNSNRFKEDYPTISLNEYYDTTKSRRFSLSKLKK